jgi:hypothetical protein
MDFLVKTGIHIYDVTVVDDKNYYILFNTSVT